MDNYFYYFFRNGPFIPFGHLWQIVTRKETNYPDNFYVIRPGGSPEIDSPGHPITIRQAGEERGARDPDAYEVSPPPSFWPPAFFGTQAVLADRYTAARVLRLALATELWKPTEPTGIAGESGWAPPPFFFCRDSARSPKGSPGARPFDPASRGHTRVPGNESTRRPSGTYPCLTDPTSDDARRRRPAIGAALAPALPDPFGALASAGVFAG